MDSTGEGHPKRAWEDVRSGETPPREWIREELWSVSVTPDSYTHSETYHAAILDLYKSYVEMADRIRARRGLTNTFFLTLNSAVFTVIGIFWKDRAPEPAITVLAVLLVVALAQCAAWFFIVRSYRQLNTVKYEVIGLLEERLPASPYYRAEWAALKKGKDWRILLAAYARRAVGPSAIRRDLYRGRAACRRRVGGPDCGPDASVGWSAGDTRCGHGSESLLHALTGQPAEDRARIPLPPRRLVAPTSHHCGRTGELAAERDEPLAQGCLSAPAELPRPDNVHERRGLGGPARGVAGLQSRCWRSMTDERRGAALADWCRGAPRTDPALGSGRLRTTLRRSARSAPRE